MPNAPFAINEQPYDRPASVLTVSPVHRFYQNRMQINDGKNDEFVAWTDDRTTRTLAQTSLHHARVPFEPATAMG